MQGALNEKKKLEEQALELKESAMKIINDKITTKTTKKVNLILGESSPEVLIGGLETLVALMRNHHKASNVDVEIYFKDFNKLTKKMLSMDGAESDEQIVTAHLEAIQKQRDEFVSAFPDLVDLMDWGTKYCEYSLKAQQVKVQQGVIDAMDKTYQESVNEIGVLREIETAITNADLIEMSENNVKEINSRAQKFKDLC